MERPENALTAEDLRAESEKWITISNGKQVLIGRVGISDILEAAMQIPNFDALLADEVSGKRLDPVASASKRLKEAKAAERIVLAGVLEPKLSAERGPGPIFNVTPKAFSREDLVTISNEILALSGYSAKEAERKGGSSETPE